MSKFSVVDIFAGPGGLAEGFSSVRGPNGERAFKIALSIEKDGAAHSTLRLRAFLRQFEDSLPAEYYAFLNLGGAEPDWKTLYPEQWATAEQEAWQMELGKEASELRLDGRIDEIRQKNPHTAVLIGGPPCQAYSLVGRARNVGKEGYVASEDDRHFLYQEYIRILDRLRPVAFIMENVKGMLSSSVDGENRIFDKVLEDLRGHDRAGAATYRLVALDPKSGRQTDFLDFEPDAIDFVIRAENFGVPQARHRVIVVGIREDLALGLSTSVLPNVLNRRSGLTTVGDVLGNMPCLRSGLTSSEDADDEWQRVVSGLMGFIAEIDTNLPEDQQLAFAAKAGEYQNAISTSALVPKRWASGTGISAECPNHLREWLVDVNLKTLPNHFSRGHMTSDLVRYFFAAVFAQVTGRSPKASDYPEELAPDHQNWKSGKFADRFRVQLAGGPSTTVTSHISKDGHYFIHPDPTQCRSLSVREAARLQTFPDNYFFKGNRTQQYVQVGNAVPPLLAAVIGEALLMILTNARTSVPAISGRLSDVA